MTDYWSTCFRFPSTWDVVFRSLIYLRVCHGCRAEFIELYKRRMQCIVLFASMALLVGAVHEKAHHTGHHERHDPMDVPKDVDGHHNPEYDEEAMLGTHDIGGISTEELKERLGLLFKEHDKNADEKITKEELMEWMLASFRHMDEEEGRITFKKDDEDSDGKVTWEELVKSQYSLSMDDIKKLGGSEEDKSTMQMLAEDEKRFKGADLNQDGQLELEEYKAFYHPYDYEHMHIFEVNRELEEKDKDGDKKLSLEEYIGEDADPEFHHDEEERFKSYDTNGDKFLSVDELKKYILPDNSETAKEEADHLIGECDKDNDLILTRSEVIDCAETFKDVQAVPDTYREEL
ncbi:reticulocalbin-2-like [Gigantopelta aegis]|uniref:reticulocalbin-2-like n=1 Tax=Gigantopelta aegis TaxID=1735272 RepID=UPI001B887A5A|nr:reticulocalbin-2-like [Gigantopelta aegis]